MNQLKRINTKMLENEFQFIFKGNVLLEKTRDQLYELFRSESWKTPALLLIKVLLILPIIDHTLKSLMGLIR